MKKIFGGIEWTKLYTDDKGIRDVHSLIFISGATPANLLIFSITGSCFHYMYFMVKEGC